MFPKRFIIFLILFLLITAIPLDGYAQSLQSKKEISTRYAKVTYSGEEALRSFNKRVKLGALSRFLSRRGEGELSIDGQVSEKVDIIIDRVKAILDMRPPNLKIDIFILSDSEKVRSAYKKRYHREVDYIAFYAPIEKAIYIGADDARSNVLAHEIAHAIIDQYFGVAAPEKIHEILAQYVDENFEE